MEWVYIVNNIRKEAIEDNERYVEKLLSKPAVGSAGATGTWRLTKPIIHEEKCRRCGLCWLHCPDAVIQWSPGEVPRIDYTYCKGCGVCSSVCPANAIEMVLEGE